MGSTTSETLKEAFSLTLTILLLAEEVRTTIDI
jgi:hypothetical protein